MQTVDVSGLKSNPGEVLRLARRDVVVVMNRDKPDALLIGVEKAEVLDVPGVRPALATALFRDGHLSLARSARLAGMPVAEFIAHISRLDIPAVEQTADEVARDMDTLEESLAASRPECARSSA
ncbi:MAG: UPF0175 family protein [Rhodocyclaceae bacterium]|nr:UPF0175 family protein [Rhodocyclaceae bacterium]MBX3670322.1 UPF0175 family protein [Rhodocyclaceae bacterium]